jgi:hypothetical protein
VPPANLTPQLIVEVIREVAFYYFSQLAASGACDSRWTNIAPVFSHQLMG